MSSQIVHGRLVPQKIIGVVHAQKVHGQLSFHVVTVMPDPYTGDYEVTPNFDTQTLETARKNMIDDVTVFPIPVYRTTNPTGGKTVFIGGNLNG